MKANDQADLFGDTPDESPVEVLRSLMVEAGVQVEFIDEAALEAVRSFVEAPVEPEEVVCDNEPDCEMCSGLQCRFCGAGCWDETAKDCQHTRIERHQWDPARHGYRIGLQRAAVAHLGTRADHMLDLIFSGNPQLQGPDFCTECNKPITRGQAALLSGKGARHMGSCPE